MADFGDKMKKAWLKSMEAIGNTAGNIANNTRYKVNEMNLVNRRREILSDFGAKAYALWQKGETFPEELAQQLEELGEVDKQLNALRTERLAGVKTGETPADEAEETTTEAVPEEEDATTVVAEEAPAAEAHAEKAPHAPTLEIPTEEASSGDAPDLEQTVTDTVDTLVNNMDQAMNKLEEAAVKSGISEKVDQALDSMGQTFKQVSSGIGSALSSMADALAGRKDTPEPPQEPVKPTMDDVPTIHVEEDSPMDEDAHT